MPGDPAGEKERARIEKTLTRGIPSTNGRRDAFFVFGIFCRVEIQ